MRDLFVADEGIGQIVGNLSIDNELMTVRLGGGFSSSRGLCVRPDRAHTASSIRS